MAVDSVSSADRAQRAEKPRERPRRRDAEAQEVTRDDEAAESRRRARAQEKGSEVDVEA